MIFFLYSSYCFVLIPWVSILGDLFYWKKNVMSMNELGGKTNER